MKASTFKISLPENQKCAIALLAMLQNLGYVGYSAKPTVKEEVEYLKAGGWKFLYLNESGEYVGCGSSYLKETGTIEDVFKMVSVPEEKVRLNSSYEAVVTTDGIKVGCQTFTLAAFDKLAEAVKKVRG